MQPAPALARQSVRATMKHQRLKATKQRQEIFHITFSISHFSFYFSCYQVFLSVPLAEVANLLNESVEINGK
jgi:hypothetical protein